MRNVRVIPRVGIEIHGGIGNQLFQYAAAYSLARRRDAALFLDTRLISKPSAHRPLALNKFGITWVPCRNPEANGALRSIGRWLRVDRNPFNGGVFRETRFTYLPEINEVRSTVFLNGYFQSWRYFSDYGDEIRSVFGLARFSTVRTTAFEHAIRTAKNPIMIHVRRGDYVAQSATFAILEKDYYQRAIAKISVDVEEPSYFVFSDDHGSAKQVLGSLQNVIYVTGLSDLEELWLMSLCSRFVIANSTFSWWGAWLGSRVGSKVAAPAKWFGPAMSGADTRDLLPRGWLVI